MDSSEAAKKLLRIKTDKELFLGDKKYFPVATRTELPGSKAKRLRFYFVPMNYYDKSRHRYRRRSKIELIYMLAHEALSGEYVVIQRYPEHQKNFEQWYGKTDEKIQGMMDAIAACREYNVRTPEELDQRVKEIGQAIGDVKKSIAYDRKTISRQPLYNAIITWRDKTASEQAKNDAYAILAAHGCTNDAQQRNALERLKMAQDRLAENEAYLTELNKSYRKAVRARESLLNAQQHYELLNAEAIKCVSGMSKSKPNISREYER